MANKRFDPSNKFEPTLDVNGDEKFDRNRDGVHDDVDSDFDLDRDRIADFDSNTVADAIGRGKPFGNIVHPGEDGVPGTADDQKADGNRNFPTDSHEGGRRHKVRNQPGDPYPGQFHYEYEGDDHNRHDEQSVRARATRTQADRDAADATSDAAELEKIRAARAKKQNTAPVVSPRPPKV